MQNKTRKLLAHGFMWLALLYCVAVIVLVLVHIPWWVIPLVVGGYALSFAVEKAQDALR